MIDLIIGLILIIIGAIIVWGVASLISLAGLLVIFSILHYVLQHWITVAVSCVCLFVVAILVIGYITGDLQEGLEPLHKYWKRIGASAS